MTAKTYLRCVRILWWTQLLALAAALVGTASTAAGRLRGFPPYLNPLEFLAIGLVAECYVVIAGGVAWAILVGENRDRGDWFLLLTCFSIVAAVATGMVWAILAAQLS